MPAFYCLFFCTVWVYEESPTGKKNKSTSSDQGSTFFSASVLIHFPCQIDYVYAGGFYSLLVALWLYRCDFVMILLGGTIGHRLHRLPPVPFQHFLSVTLLEDPCPSLFCFCFQTLCPYYCWIYSWLYKKRKVNRTGTMVTFELLMAKTYSLENITTSNKRVIWLKNYL